MKKTSKALFLGVATALITPFKDGRIDYYSLEKLLEFQIENGVDAILINGTTGEGATLSDEEKRELIAFTIKKVNKRVPTVAGTGSNSTQKALELSKFASDSGADALLVVTPYYNKASREGLLKHYTSIADTVDAPTIIYNVPSRTGVNIPLEIYRELARHENIIGVKEASSSMSDFARLSEACGDLLALYSGNDDLILPALALGGSGVISVLSNLLPKKTAELCKLYFSGKTNEATALQLELLPLINALFSEVNPIPIKALLAHRGFCREEYRLPLCPLDEAKRKAIIEIAERY